MACSRQGEPVLKAAAFDYVRATTLPEAIALLQQNPEARLLAGGQSLLPALNLRLSAPTLLVDIAHIPALRGIALDGHALRIGALTTYAELLRHPLVGAHAPLLPRAAAHVAHPAIRTRGTIGGSLANADPAAELPACALALDATLLAEGPAGARRIPAASFFTGLFATALASDEILVAIKVPLTDAQWGFAELARRSGDYAIVGLAAQAAPIPRLAYFAVGTQATLAHRAAAALAQHGYGPAGLEAASAALAEDLDPHDDLQATAATRLHLAQVLLRRVVSPWALGPQAAAA